MRPLDLDFLRTGRAPGWAGWLLAVAALAFAADVALGWRALYFRIQVMEVSLARAPSSSSQNETGATAPDADEIAFARETVRQLATPWDRLFAALEAAQTERVALLAIEPDAAAGTVTVRAEARDYLAALTYVAGLSAQGSLKRVHLARHELARGGPRPVAFAVQASWRETR